MSAKHPNSERVSGSGEGAGSGAGSGSGSGATSTSSSGVEPAGQVEPSRHRKNHRPSAFQSLRQDTDPAQHASRTPPLEYGSPELGVQSASGGGGGGDGVGVGVGGGDAGGDGAGTSPSNVGAVPSVGQSPFPSVKTPKVVMYARSWVELMRQAFVDPPDRISSPISSAGKDGPPKMGSENSMTTPLLDGSSRT